MTTFRESSSELERLLELLCEDRLTTDELSKLEQLVLSSPEARWAYLKYMDLHGTLYWDAAGAGSAEPLSALIEHETTIHNRSQSFGQRAVRRQNYPQMISVISACLALVVVGVWQVSNVPPRMVKVERTPIKRTTVGVVSGNHPHRSAPRMNESPVSLVAEEIASVPIPEDEAQFAEPPASTKVALPPASIPDVVGQINKEIEQGWATLELRPSPPAVDSLWMRRLYLDLFGRIPTVAEIESFQSDKRANKREELIERSLGDFAYARNFSTKWANLLIGRSSNSQVDREAFHKFLRLSFAENRPWNSIVSDLISAEGNNAENGAVNFLIAHLNNDATPATAIVSKMFLGRQVQCNQCHNNPFDESKQIAFWEMNSFFQQTAAISRQQRDAQSGRLNYLSTELVTQDVGGPTYFESQYGLMRVAYPTFNGRAVNPSPDVNRRRELARLMTSGDQPQLAASLINRMWEHFFGWGFTHSVDDMGPHQAVSHPELLAYLSDQFVRSDYDIKQLIRWICLSEAYQLSGDVIEANQSDDPARGEMPAFSHQYARYLTAEQTYDSFLAATKAHQVGAVDWTQAEKNRQEWLQQFVVAFHTDENDETMTFEGSIGNALSMMNGPLVDKALEISGGSFLGEIVRGKATENEKIRQLCLATWSRVPTSGELTSMKKLIRDAMTSRGSREAFQDLFWALLNSNEFILSR